MDSCLNSQRIVLVPMQGRPEGAPCWLANYVLGESRRDSGGTYFRALFHLIAMSTVGYKIWKHTALWHQSTLSKGVDEHAMRTSTLLQNSHV